MTYRVVRRLSLSVVIETEADNEREHARMERWAIDNIAKANVGNQNLSFSSTLIHREEGTTMTGLMTGTPSSTAIEMVQEILGEEGEG